MGVPTLLRPPSPGFPPPWPQHVCPRKAQIPEQQWLERVGGAEQCGVPKTGLGGSACTWSDGQPQGPGGRARDLGASDLLQGPFPRPVLPGSAGREVPQCPALSQASPSPPAATPALEGKCRSGEKRAEGLLKEKRRLEAELEAVSRKTHDASGQLVLISQELLCKER